VHPRRRRGSEGSVVATREQCTPATPAPRRRKANHADEAPVHPFPLATLEPHTDLSAGHPEFLELSDGGHAFLLVHEAGGPGDRYVVHTDIEGLRVAESEISTEFRLLYDHNSVEIVPGSSRVVATAPGNRLAGGCTVA
jgi:hypothetical protein